MKRITIITMVVLFAFSGAGQDMHFSQFNENPSLINPALTGATAFFRASVAFKDQWKSVSTPYRTLGASLEMRTPGRRKRAGKFGFSKNRSDGRFGTGFSVYRDRAGEGKMGMLMMNLSLAGFVPTGKRSFISVGLQGSMIQRRLDYGPLIFPNQYSEAGYDPNIGSNEMLEVVSFKHPDFAAGLLWSYGQDEKTFITHREFKARIGGAVYHVTQPQQKYISPTAQLAPMKYVAHGDMLFDLPKSSTALAPAFLFQMQGVHAEILAGAMFRYHTSNDTRYTGLVRRTTLGAGVYYRTGDAVIFSMLFELQEQTAIGLSYDLNISPLRAASRSRGGLELTLRYRSANSFLYQKR